MEIINKTNMKKENKVVEYDLQADRFNWEIAPGKIVEAWGFNNQLPGPVLEANAGDTLVVRVTNHLDESTIVHWHGIRIPASMDGTVWCKKRLNLVKHLNIAFWFLMQELFWYHSHQNETIQMERGLYGALIVRDESDPVMDGERIFLIDDMKLDDDNNFTKPRGFIQRIVETHDGRQGHTLS